MGELMNLSELELELKPESASIKVEESEDESLEKVVLRTRL